MNLDDSIQLADLVEKHKNEIASLESLDNGKPFMDAFRQTGEAVNFLRYFAGLADKVHGKTLPNSESNEKKKFFTTFDAFADNKYNMSLQFRSQMEISSPLHERSQSESSVPSSPGTIPLFC